MRHGVSWVTEPFLCALIDTIVAQMSGAYPNSTQQDTIGYGTAKAFRRGSDRGFPARDAIDRAASSNRTLGDEAFKLYDTFGLPFDFIEDLAGERHVGVDRDGFERAMEGQRERARSRSSFDGKTSQDFAFDSQESRQGLNSAGDRFEGYTTTTVRGTPVLALFDKDRRQVRELKEGSQGYAALGITPFYVESGGQVSDVGELHAEGSGASALVEG